ncbi:MAG: AAA family ATPase [Actinobacteria bacterium]|nr:AAA family ATPase [Actinomycetota bacterium]
MPFTAQDLEKECQAAGLEFPDHVLEQLTAAIDAGKHVILTGPPGTGKTSLAFLAAEVAQRRMMCTGFLPTTATTEWTTFETIGGFQPTSEGLIYRPGLFVEAIETGRWLVIDELNRSNFDRAFGQLFTVLSGQAVVLPFKRAGQMKNLSLVPYGAPVPEDTEPIRVPSSWRIVATMNVFDKNLLFDMSYALMRRFAFIELNSPDEDGFRRILGDDDLVLRLLPLRQFRDLGPAVYLDARKYAERRRQDEPTESRLLYEMFYAYFLPQLEGLDDTTSRRIFRFMAGMLAPPEVTQVRRTMGEVLGADLGT